MVQLLLTLRKYLKNLKKFHSNRCEYLINRTNDMICIDLALVLTVLDEYMGCCV